MRKMFLSALACVAFAGNGFASNEVVLENLPTEAIVEDDAVCTNWVTYQTTCGKVFYLCGDNYASDADLVRAIVYYQSIQCRGFQASNPGMGMQG